MNYGSDNRMKNEMIPNNQGYYDDRIDLVDLIKILIRNKVLIISTFFIITLISGVGSYIENSKTTYKATLEFMYKAEKLKTKDDVEVYTTKINLLKSLLDTTDSKFKIVLTGNSSKELKEILKNDYEEVIKKAEKIGLEKEKFILLNESFEEEKNKSIMILAIGMILGLFFGIFLAFMKEFVKDVDWSEKK